MGIDPPPPPSPPLPFLLLLFYDVLTVSGMRIVITRQEALTLTLPP